MAEFWHILHTQFNTPPADCNGSFYSIMAFSPRGVLTTMEEMIADGAKRAAFSCFHTPEGNSGYVIHNTKCVYQSLAAFPACITLKYIGFKKITEHTAIEPPGFGAVLGVVGDHVYDSAAWDSANIWFWQQSASISTSLSNLPAGCPILGVSNILKIKKDAEGLLFEDHLGNHAFLATRSSITWVVFAPSSTQIGASVNAKDGYHRDSETATYTITGKYRKQPGDVFGTAGIMPIGIVPQSTGVSYPYGLVRTIYHPIPIIFGNLGKSDHSVFPPSTPLALSHARFLPTQNAITEGPNQWDPWALVKMVNVAKYDEAQNIGTDAFRTTGEWSYTDGGSPPWRTDGQFNSNPNEALSAGSVKMAAFIQSAYDHRKDSVSSDAWSQIDILRPA